MLKTRSLIIGVVLVLTALAGGGAGWLVLNEDRLASALIERLEAHLLTDAHIDHIELDLWSRFPHVSLVLHDAWLHGSHSPNDTLVKAEELAVACNAFDLITGNYRLNALDIRNGQLALTSDRNGWNTNVWQSVEADEQSESFAIERLAIRGLQLTVDDSQVQIEQADLQLGWTESGIDLDGDGAFSAVSTDDFSTDERVTWNGNGKWNSAVDTAFISLNSLEWKGLQSSLDIRINEGWSLHGELSGVTFETLQDVVTLPASLSEIRTNARASGRIDWDGTTFRSNWNIPTSNWKVPVDGEDLPLQGSARVWLKYENGNWRADAPALELRTEGAAWSGKVDRILLESGSFEAIGRAEINWEEANPTFVQNLDGPEQGQMEWDGMVKRKQNGAFDWAGTWTASGCHGRFNGVPWSADGSGSLDGNELTVDTVYGAWGDIAVQAAVRGGLPIAGTTSTPWRGSVHVPEWTYNATDTGSVSLASFRLPEGFKTDLDVTMDRIQYNGWALNEIQLRIQGTSNAWTVPSFQATTLEGRLIGDGSCTFQTDSQSATIQLHPTASACNLPLLFDAFDNFEQSTLRAEHLRGTFDASGSVQFTLGPQLQWDPNTLDVLGSASIHDGQLSDLEAFQDIADYLRSNRLMAPLVDPDDLAQRLTEVQFEHVESPVYISKGTVQLPSTSIRSSAMDITLAGAYRFDSSIDYTLGFAMRDLRSTEESEFGTIQDDGLGHQFFVSMTGTVAEPKYGWDREAQKNHRKENLQREKELLKELFRKSKP